MSIDTKNPLLDSVELGTELKVPVRTLDQWAYLGKGPPFIKIGRHRRYRRTDVEQWLDAHTKTGDSPDAA